MINFEILMNNCAKQWYEYTNHEFAEKLKLEHYPLRISTLFMPRLSLMEYSKAWEYAVYNAKILVKVNLPIKIYEIY